MSLNNARRSNIDSLVERCFQVTDLTFSGRPKRNMVQPEALSLIGYTRYSLSIVIVGAVGEVIQVFGTMVQRLQGDMITYLEE